MEPNIKHYIKQGIPFFTDNRLQFRISLACNSMDVQALFKVRKSTNKFIFNIRQDILDVLYIVMYVIFGTLHSAWTSTELQVSEILNCNLLSVKNGIPRPIQCLILGSNVVPSRYTTSYLVEYCRFDTFDLIRHLV